MSKIDFESSSVDTRTQTCTEMAKRVLVVGSQEKWAAEFGMPKGADEIKFFDLKEISKKSMGHYRPSVVLSPVISRAFDCVDVAMLLFSLDFNGVYRALSSHLPNPDIVRREIRAQCPGLDFDVVMVEGGRSSRGG